MTVPARYRGFWLPGLAHDVDVDDSLRVAFAWLAHAEREDGRPGIVAMYAKSMAGNRRLLSEAASRWRFVSPRSDRPRGYGPVLAIWPPDARVVEFAESLALDRAFCVVAGHYDITPWIKKSGATCLVEGWDLTSRCRCPRRSQRLSITCLLSMVTTASSAVAARGTRSVRCNASLVATIGQRRKRSRTT